MTQSANTIRLGIVLKPEHYILDRFVCASTPYLIRGLIERFSCEIISSQADYEKHYDSLDAFFSLEPKYAAPLLNWRPLKHRLTGKPRKLSYALCSDPHQSLWRQDYILKHDISFLLGFYKRPFLKHFTKMPPERVIHFPWTVPDSWFSFEPLHAHDQKEISVFGATNSPAYTVRKWCHSFPFVRTHSFSGVENKAMTDAEYFEWLKQFDAMIAAGSDDPKYDLTTPKYFEIAASGALLFAQETGDLEDLGFKNEVNCIVFTKENFGAKARDYLADPESYLHVREAGRQMVYDKHRLSVRLDFLEEHIRQNL